MRREFPKRIKSDVLTIISTFRKKKITDIYMVFVHAGMQDILH